MKLLDIFIIFIQILPIFGQNKSATVDLCQPSGNDCGFMGLCKRVLTGNRCQCQKGRMGLQCRRPCQDVYKSCEKWKKEGRCKVKRTPFFTDNCALTCESCQSNGQKLIQAIPPILEPLAWIVGRWEAKVISKLRFPTPMLSTGYNEILDIQIGDVNMFDRPTLNYSVVARSLDGLEIHNELGFIALKPARETNGFVKLENSRFMVDQVAIEMSSNTGLNIIEEGILGGKAITLKTTHMVSMDNHDERIISAKRTFTLAAPQVLDEQILILDPEGKQRQFTKRFRQIFDYLKAIDSQ